MRNVKLSGKGKEFDINLRLENVGLGDAKDVIAELKTPYRGFKKNFQKRTLVTGHRVVLEKWK